MTTYRQAVTVIAWVLFFHALGLFALYSWYPYYDIPMHYAGGLAMGVLGLAVWDHLVRGVRFSVKKKWLSGAFTAFCVLGFVALIGIGWEWFEFLFDAFVAERFDLAVTQASVADTMGDFFFDLAGGASVVLWRKI
ncbi:MAG: hypothetical protein Q7R47_05545 [Candidatus Diapherotrites archaeon]|nr:hypothetical protein [Candidatus Diapherotrites archaeon]